MPRKSVASLSVVASITDARPQPLEHLTEAEQAEWQAVVSALPAQWFRRETHQLLAAYCQHVTTVKVLGKEIAKFKPEWLVDDDGLKRYEKLLAARDKEVRAVASLTTKLRLTPQSRYQPNTAASKVSRAPTGSRPWDADVKAVAR